MRMWEISLQQQIMNLFSPTACTRLDRTNGCSYADGQVAAQLRSRAPHALPVQRGDPEDLMGSRVKELRQFRYGLRQVLKELAACGFLTVGKTDARTDPVVVDRNHTNFEAIA